MSFKMLLDELEKNEALRGFRPEKGLLIYIKDHKLHYEQADALNPELISLTDMEQNDWQLGVKVE